MILTDIELWAEIDAGRLVFEPKLEREGQRPQLQTSTIDLRLGHAIREFKGPVGGVQIVVDPSHAEYDLDRFLHEFTELKTIPHGEYYDLRPKTPLLAQTLERVTLPPHLSGRVEGRSSLARLGLTVHNTAPYVHPGYNDHLTLELYYVGKIDFRLRPGELRICQLIVERVGLPPLQPYPGQYRPG